MAADLQTLRRRHAQLLAQRGTWEGEWKLLAEFLAPRRGNTLVGNAPGVKQTTRLFDSSGPMAAQLFAASLGGTLTSPVQKWFSLVARQGELHEIKEVRDWLEEVAARTYLALSQSNFVAELGEVYLDLAVFGTGGLLVIEGEPRHPGQWGGLLFRALQIGEYAIAEDAAGRVDTVFRQFELSARAISEQWGADVVGDALRNLATQHPDQLVKVVHAVYPRTEYDARRPDGLNRRWASCYYVPQWLQRLGESGFYEFPYVVARWTKASGEVYGRGPGHLALPDIRSLNRAVELYLTAAAKAIDPPLNVVNDGVTGSVSLEPSAMNVVSAPSDITALEGKQRFDVAALLNERLERKINAAFYVDLARLRERPNMTATEVLAQHEEMLRFLGPTAGRLHSELLGQIIDRAVALQLRAGVLPPIPDILLEGAGDVDVEYEGPLARAQKSGDLAAIERFMTWGNAAAAADPTVWDNVEWDEMARHYAQIAGVPSNLVRGPQQVAAIRAARQQAQQAAAQLQMLSGAAEAAGKAAPALKLIQGQGAPAPATVAA